MLLMARETRRAPNSLCQESPVRTTKTAFSTARRSQTVSSREAGGDESHTYIPLVPVLTPEYSADLEASFPARPEPLYIRKTSSPLPQGRIHSHRQQSHEQPSPLLPLFKYTRRSPSSSLWNPVNYIPRSATRSSRQQRTALTGDSQPKRDADPLLTLPERRRILSQRSSVASIPLKTDVDEPDAVNRTSIGLPRRHRRADTWGAIEMVNYSGASAGQSNHLRPPERPYAVRNGNLFSMNGSPAAQQHPDDPPETPRHVNSHLSIRPQTFIAVPPVNVNNASTNPQSPSGPPNGDATEELSWGPAHPCFPHMNTHVSLNSEDYVHTRVIRIRRDWMVKGDLAPTFSNLYPEILDPLLGEQEFRTIITKINEELINAFDPYAARNWFDGIMGFLTGWLWDDLGASRIKSRIKGLEAWIDKWNREVGAAEGVKIWGPRRTGFLSLDIQIPDPKIGIVESDAGSDLGTRTRPSTANTRLHERPQHL
ncbi:Golgin subfamily A member 7/ERF4 [Trichophyton rubrum]|nr:Golgin subfamily A member 7/ERF4 [Trichophyton rubrum]